MSTSTPFKITPEALEILALSLKQRPETQVGLIMFSNFETFDEQEGVEARFEKESFWIAYDSPDYFSHWPRIELCGQSVPVAPDALERLRGKTLTVEGCDAIFDGNRLLVVA